MIAIVDYGAGNIRSIENACNVVGMNTVVTDSAKTIARADKILLPGVGAFGAAMRELIARGLVEVLKQKLQQGVPFLGICLGMQLLFERSEESPDCKGLGVIPGTCVRVPTGRVPNIGWCKTLDRISNNETYFYYVHSFCVVPENPKTVQMQEVDTRFCAAVVQNNIWGVQFHPEKSADAGLAFLKRWCSV